MLEEGGVAKEGHEGVGGEFDGGNDSEEELTKVAASKYHEFERTCGDLLDPGK